MENSVEKVDNETGSRLQCLRRESGLTLERLAELSGVSRAMISRIERGEASPTAALLARLVAALGQSLSSFFAGSGHPGCGVQQAFHPLDSQHVWTDPGTGYVRRSVSPPGTGSGVDLVDVTLPAGKSVSFPPQASSEGVMQHVWVLEGSLFMEVEGRIHQMQEGDCLFHDIGRGHRFENRSDVPVRYAVVLEHQRNRDRTGR